VSRVGRRGLNQLGPTRGQDVVRAKMQARHPASAVGRGSPIIWIMGVPHRRTEMTEEDWAWIKENAAQRLRRFGLDDRQVHTEERKQIRMLCGLEKHRSRRRSAPSMPRLNLPPLVEDDE
jgi:hypothetical protein